MPECESVEQTGPRIPRPLMDLHSFAMFPKEIATEKETYIILPCIFCFTYTQT